MVKRVSSVKGWKDHWFFISDSSLARQTNSKMLTVPIKLGDWVHIYSLTRLEPFLILLHLPSSLILFPHSRILSIIQWSWHFMNLFGLSLRKIDLARQLGLKTVYLHRTCSLFLLKWDPRSIVPLNNTRTCWLVLFFYFASRVGTLMSANPRLRSAMGHVDRRLRSVIRALGDILGPFDTGVLLASSKLLTSMRFSRCPKIYSYFVSLHYPDMPRLSHVTIMERERPELQNPILCEC